jgi:hypothetical protein
LGRLVPILLWGLIACDLGSVTEQELPSEAARLSVRAQLAIDPDGPPGTALWLIDVYLDPGFEQGLRRDVGDTLLVDEQPVLPEPSYGSSTIWYTFRVEIPEDEVYRRSMTVVPPAVEALPSPVVRLIGIARAGTDTLRWTPGSDLTLRLNPPATPPEPAPSEWQWRATVVAAESFSFHLSARGLPPAEIVIPGTYLANATPPTQARLEFYAHYSEPTYGGVPYEVRISIWGTLTWVIEVEP